MLIMKVWGTALLRGLVAGVGLLYAAPDMHAGNNNRKCVLGMSWGRLALLGCPAAGVGLLHNFLRWY
jgi:hypothetical protein